MKRYKYKKGFTFEVAADGTIGRIIDNGHETKNIKPAKKAYFVDFGNGWNVYEVLENTITENINARCYEIIND